MAKLHRLDDSIDNKRGPKTGSQSEVQPFASAVAPQSLHRRVIDDLDRAAERTSIIEPDPAPAQIVWLGDWSTAQHDARVTDLDHFISPVLVKLFDTQHHSLGRQIWSRVERARFGLSCGENLDVRSAHIDNQNIHWKFS